MLGPMTAIRTARELARAELTSQIKAEARRQVAADGAQRLSLRAVARELGMASSALYRYFPSRDDLLTALIIDAYDALGEEAERSVAAVPGSDSRGRWRSCCHAVRSWALAHPHEYALIYGSPVPGYEAPRETVAPAGRVAAAFGGVLADAWSAGVLGPPPDGRPSQPLAGQLELAGQVELVGQLERVGQAIAPGVPAAVLARAFTAWTQLFGMVSFELFGQLVGSVDPADAFFGYAVDQMADLVGLPR